MRDRNPRTSLLIRNLPTDIRQEELRDIFSDGGRIALRDAYLPRDYYTGKVRGFGFVEFIDDRDAEDAERHFDGTVIGGRTITVVFSKQDRKTPREMAVEPGYGSRERSPGPGRSRRRRSPSPRHERSRTPVRRRTRSPRERRRSPSPAERKRSPSPARSKSREPSRSLPREPSASRSPVRD
ncbi:g4911 [Coccomyxa viridis]|uniref:G4911 protein n=1 Tax=Coccomyxa viridis TaxID=1274662 RepID=A0ABP1FSX6_9CHLO